MMSEEADDPVLPPMTPVSSSNISEIGHDPVTNEMFVRFTSGTLYRYPDVDASTHRLLADAKSVGAHFAQHIRGQFNGEKMG